MISKEIHLINRPKGLPVDNDFAVVEVSLPELAANQVQVRNLYMSVDPYMRGRMADATVCPLNQVINVGGGAVGVVEKSTSDGFKEGDVVTNNLAWRDRFISAPDGLTVVNPDVDLKAYLSVLGMPGFTAYGGLLHTGKLQEGERVFVSAASGAVGSMVGQIAKIKNCTVIGSAGSDDKVSYLTNELGFDHAFNYKTSDILAELKQGSPKGLDVYFENVGGAQLEAALTHMRPLGRIPVCGMISVYNNEKAAPGPSNLTEIIYKRVSLIGMVVTEYFAIPGFYQQFVDDVSGWLQSGQLKYESTVVEGIENTPKAFRGLFDGTNKGKMIVKL